MSSAAAPDFPRSAAAAADAGSPAETSAAESVRIAGSPRSATADRPSVVENMKGIANQAMPPSRYAFTHDAGRLAIARCQYCRYDKVNERSTKSSFRQLMTYSLVLEDGGEVPDDVDDTEDEAVL